MTGSDVDIVSANPTLLQHKKKHVIPLYCEVVANRSYQNVDRATNRRERKGSETGMEESARE
jgi:hypothetical protein